MFWRKKNVPEHVAKMSGAERLAYKQLSPEYRKQVDEQAPW